MKPTSPTKLPMQMHLDFTVSSFEESQRHRSEPSRSEEFTASSPR